MMTEPTTTCGAAPLAPSAFAEPQNWLELIRLEPRLQAVARLIELLPRPDERDRAQSYAVVKTLVNCLLGNMRGGQTPNVRDTSMLRLSLLMDEPLTDAERFLRSRRAYDIGMFTIVGLARRKGLAA